MSESFCRECSRPCVFTCTICREARCPAHGCVCQAAPSPKVKRCIDCRWWKEQSGSAHVLCPSSPDFSFSWDPQPCELFAPVKEGEKVDRHCNQFMAWFDGTGVPSHESIAAYLKENP